MKLTSSILLSLLSLSARAELGSGRPRSVKRAEIVTEGVPPPPGTYVPVPTFFVGKNATNYSAVAAPVDLETQVAYSLYLANAGMTGQVIFGSTGEAIHVTRQERINVISSTRAALDKAGFTDYPLIAGVVTQIFEEVIDELQKSKDAGAQWGLCLVPGYFAVATTQEGILGWYTAVADASPMPIMIYDYPTVANNIKVTPATYAELAKHPNIVGAKLAFQDLSWHAQISSNPSIDYTKFHPYTGIGQQLLPAVTVGAFGAMDVVGSFFPKSIVQLYKLSSLAQPTAEQKQDAQALQYKVAAMGEFLNTYNIIGIKEAVSRLRGFGSPDAVRLPLLGSITEDEWASWQGVVDVLQEVEDSL
ncbi:Uu.00g074190.m01.CDS01 [Anthostomella pinea]|uniref:Uu.00g074190.m01.CDS01 n=1 Tax=Anthostomella pinea TaxID=933095 RepID=A0AAI8YNW8_9PEZI|nr:Uu.00g074190.m01.CDS01 [Anthostomella pinea]